MIVTLHARLNPLSMAAAALVLLGVLGMMRGRVSAGAGDRGCGEADPGCVETSGSLEAAALEGRRALTLDADVACRNAGYLCAELADRERLRIRRWNDFDGTLVVHVPRPQHEDPGDALNLQRAAALGIRAWNNEPFPILVDLRGDREAHFSVHWTTSLGGSQIGVARTRWSPGEGLSVVSVDLTTRNPFRPDRVADTRQVRLTAAHEMGHALGLGHSDSEHDVMYPTNTATSVSAQDRRTMEVLYRLANGTEIVR